MRLKCALRIIVRRHSLEGEIKCVTRLLVRHQLSRPALVCRPNATDRIGALRTIHETRANGEFVTGLLFVDPTLEDLCEREKLPNKPLKDLNEEDLRISREAWSALFD